MDTTKTYIKMCEKAEKIQESRQLQWGDWISLGSLGVGRFERFTPYNDVITWQYNDVEWRPRIHNIHSLVWLPRQDELQEIIIKDTLLYPERLATVFINWLQNEKYFDKDSCSHWKHSPYTSMEQLWLAFVMKENHNKIWDGEQWISG